MAVCGEEGNRETGERRGSLDPDWPTTPAPLTHLYCGLVGLGFDSQRLPDPLGSHISQAASLSVHTPGASVSLGVLGLGGMGRNISTTTA